MISTVALLMLLAAGVEGQASDDQIQAVGQAYIADLLAGSKPVGIQQLLFIDNRTTELDPAKFKPIDLSRARALLSECTQDGGRISRFLRDGEAVDGFDSRWSCVEDERKFNATVFLEVRAGKVVVGRMLWNLPIITVQVPVR